MVTLAICPNKTHQQQVRIGRSLSPFKIATHGASYGSVLTMTYLHDQNQGALGARAPPTFKVMRKSALFKKGKCPFCMVDNNIGMPF